MTSQNDHYFGLIKLILPEELFDYFELTNVEVQGKQVHVYLEEADEKPAGYEGKKLISKGFHSPVTIQDFPLRDKAMFLHIRRRRWLVESSGQVISRDWNTIAKGTRMTKGFAAFLKGLFGQLPHQQQ
ncbi:ISAon1 family transposase N-terminal region protein [Sunxiuqinia indica]|uniref:ISAon1 family transposase N-terminal region protein n=1 Tax=Sunxiuqinia indica TaxID=2692584 RepID=UPI001358B5DE|nr:transposase [Sunxiuqinia indica]